MVATEKAERAAVNNNRRVSIPFLSISALTLTRLNVIQTILSLCSAYFFY